MDLCSLSDSSIHTSSISSNSKYEIIEALNVVFEDTGDVGNNKKKLYNFLAKYFPNPKWTFMNYGFASKDNDVKQVKLTNVDNNDPFVYLNQLYAAVIDDNNLQGLNVIDIGCGRGGGSAWIARNLNVKSITGIDISENVIELCRQLHSCIPNLRFEYGDAQCLPCSDESYDVMINVESSHNYKSMENFLNEAHRVLKPGGYFLWTDFRSKDDEITLLEQFKRSGLELIELVNITENVMLGFERTKEARHRFIEEFPNELQIKLQHWIDILYFEMVKCVIGDVN